MSHPVIDDLRWRYTAKKYDADRKISEQDLTVLFEAMRLSASSINSQPWKFIVLESDEAKRRMSRTFVRQFHFNEPHIFDCSHVILFAHNPRFTRDDYAEIVEDGIRDGRTRAADREGAFGPFVFAELNTDDKGDTSCWTKAQVYLALGNTLHTLARLRIDSTPMEGVDTVLLSQEFNKELGGYECALALTMGYHHPDEDYNAKLPKSRRHLDNILMRI